MTPAPSEAIAAKAASERSMMRPAPWGPRSLIFTSTVLPLLRLVTRTIVPKGKVRWAAVSLL